MNFGRKAWVETGARRKKQNSSTRYRIVQACAHHSNLLVVEVQQINIYGHNAVVAALSSVCLPLMQIAVYGLCTTVNSNRRRLIGTPHDPENTSLQHEIITGVERAIHAADSSQVVATYQICSDFMFCEFAGHSRDLKHP
jgi:hypothetical protein